MDETRLNEIRERHARATKGPWKADEDTRYVVAAADDDCVIADMLSFNDEPLAESIETHIANAAFIAASWQDIADLLEEVERLRGMQAFIAEGDAMLCRDREAGNVFYRQNPDGTVDAFKIICETGTGDPA